MVSLGQHDGARPTLSDERHGEDREHGERRYEPDDIRRHDYTTSVETRMATCSIPITRADQTNRNV